jgi:hypothetical protein
MPVTRDNAVIIPAILTKAMVVLPLTALLERAYSLRCRVRKKVSDPFTSIGVLDICSFSMIFYCSMWQSPSPTEPPRN